MTIPMLLAYLLSTLIFRPVPLDIQAASNAIVASDQGVEIWWYEPTIRVSAIKGAPSGWKGAVSCQPYWGGVIYLNPAVRDPNGEAFTVMHELVHLHTGCSTSETETELGALEALAYMRRDSDISYWIIDAIGTLSDNKRNLPDNILREYYRIPLYTLLYGDLAEYPNLRAALIRLGVREYDVQIRDGVVCR